MNSLSLCTTMTSPPQHFVNSLWRCSLQHLAMRYHFLHTKSQKIKKLVMEIMSGTAVNDLKSIFVMANNEEHYSDSNLAHIFFFFKVQYCNQKQYFSNFCVVRSKLKLFELNFGTCSDSSDKNNFLKLFFNLSLKWPFESTVNTPIQIL